MSREWIPVTNKLPATSGRFEVTIESRKGKRRVEMCNFNSQSTMHPWGDSWDNINVVAWRQRDKPYCSDKSSREVEEK